ncbi:class I SAM-dependent methyltransferase [Rheinheimera sp. MMS21-TC3]|uniref:class I SAM-dependent methyltransferase n=1 Tax=Rheinheimera sp. MMS21-TC3 TaxID=3072790 RepID=UPI0028C4BFA1|nr:class I SAM-dependent methyltransferase [Rheinheimera sp. MMS21-TC3]WNO61528.1 class I SAM-dependent methyltransferase [Rheinheimera sp. MMS21-TC3]
MLANSSQLVLRNIDDLKGSVLIVEPVADELGSQLVANAENITLSCFTTDKAVATLWQQPSIELIFDIAPQFSQPFDSIVIFYPKSKEQLAYTLSQLKTAFSADSQVFVVGDNKGGIKSLANHALKLGLTANKLDNAKHCLWFMLHGDLANLKDTHVISFTIDVLNTTLTLYSLPGVFNHGKLDNGTALLLANLPNVNQGNVLDFACGNGVVGAVLKRTKPNINLFCSDISTLATDATKLTLAKNQLSATVITADGIPEIPEHFAAIVSNPPFHTGIKTNYAIVEKFIQQSAQRLVNKGSLTIVANNHLEYLPILQQHFKQVDIKAKANGFTIFHAVKL